MMLAKTISHAIAPFAVVFRVNNLLSGSILISSAIAMFEPAVNTVACYFYEKTLNRLPSRRQIMLPLRPTEAY